MISSLQASSVVRIRDEVGQADPQSVQRLVASTGFFGPEEIAIARELVDEHLRRGDASGYRFAFADAGDELAGYACFGPVPATASSFHLYWIAVAPAWQRRGIGGLLLEHVVAVIRAAGGERVYAETSSRAQYEPTRSFYLESGFRVVASLPDHFAAGEAKVIYEKSIGR